MLKTKKKKLIHTLRVLKARPKIAKLIDTKYAKLNAIGYALLDTLDKKLLKEEMRLITLIENRRLFLLNSDSQIEVIDYGAGSSLANLTEEEMRRGKRYTTKVSKVCSASKPAFWALFLFKLIRKVKPIACLELGSCVGISGAYLASALKLNKIGRLMTLEGCPEVAKIAEDTLNELNLDNASVIAGPFHNTYKNSLIQANPVDFIFNDGHHDYNAVLKYFSQAFPYFAKEAIIVIDDISWSTGMKKAWTKIKNDKRVAITINLSNIGIAIISNEYTDKINISIPL